MAEVTGIMVNSGTRIRAKGCGTSLGLSPNMGFLRGPHLCDSSGTLSTSAMSQSKTDLMTG